MSKRDSRPRGGLAGAAYACTFAVTFIACWTTTPWLLVVAFVLALLEAASRAPPG